MWDGGDFMGSATTGAVAPDSMTKRLTRAFSWAMLAALPAFLINNYLTVAHAWPGPLAALTGEHTGQSGAQLGLFLALVFAGGMFGLRNAAVPLRTQAQRITEFDAFLVRAAFWGVLLVGLADFAISFLRVENMLDQVIGHALGAELARPQFRGPYVHIPLLLVGVVLAVFTRTLGFTWLALLIVAAELGIVISRFVFSYEQAFMGDLVRFWYAALFLFASAHTLMEDGHVRVDVFYAGMRSRTKGFINAWGSILLGITFCWVILITGMDGKTAIINAPVMNFEVSQSGFGMYVKYLMAGYLGVFAITMLIQFVAYLLESVADWYGEPASRQPAAAPIH
jgi:TRAP-type mannitol/chloroaromatic compound transport system permease small subunit